MSSQIFENNSVNETVAPCESPSRSRFSPTQQWSPSRHPATARVKLNKEVNKVVIKCFHRNKPFDETEISLSEYSKRIFKEKRFLKKRMFESTEQRKCDQSMAIRKNGCLFRT